MKVIISTIILCYAITAANAQQLTDSSGFTNTNTGNTYAYPGQSLPGYTFPTGQDSSLNSKNSTTPSNENNNFDLQNSNLNSPMYLSGTDSSGKEQFQQKENLINTH